MKSGSPPTEACREFVLTDVTNPAALISDRDDKQKQADKLQPVVDRDAAEVSRLTKLARDECAGTDGPGLTGDKGYGQACVDRNKDVQTYLLTHQVEANSRTLTELRAGVAALSTQITAATDSFAAERGAGIEARLGQARANQTTPGLLERINALHALASHETTLFFAIWAVRLLLILVDCLPVVIKFSAGDSWYDKALRTEALSQRHRHTEKKTLMVNESSAFRALRMTELEDELDQMRTLLLERRGERVSGLVNGRLRSRRDRP